MFGMTANQNPATPNAPYTLTGPRGGVKRLIRHPNNPRLMYVINENGVICSIKGNYTFADDGSKGLRPVYAYNLYQ